MTKKLSQEDAERRIKSISNINFIRWDSEYSGVKTKAVMKCSIDGFEWLVTANNLIHNNRGCPQCSGKRRWTAIERVNQISDGGVVRFERWLDGYSGTKSRAVVSCVKCDYEYDVLITSIIHKRSGCPSCYGKINRSQDDCEKFISSIDGVSFVGWRGEYKNSKSRAIIKCDIDGAEWSQTLTSITSKGARCPECSGVKRFTEWQRIEQINSVTGISFVRWLCDYKNAKSKAVVRCDIDGNEWSVSIDNLLTKGSGCPRCAKYGFDGSICGYVYFLVSRCGSFVKVGITNNINDRISYLRLKTPFDFDVVEYAHFSKGSDALALESKLHKIMNSAGLSGFNGCTEWFLFDDYASSALGEIRKINGA